MIKAKLIRFSVLFFSSLLLSACTLPFGNRAGVQVTANPQGNVFLNDQPLGQTRVYQEDNKPGEYTLKIVPSDTTLQSWEGRVNLTSGTLTVVDRQLATSPEKAQGYILSFEKLSDKNAAEVNIVSLPNTVSILVDGNPSGFTPLSTSSIAAGGHTFTFTAPGFAEKVVKATVQGGYRLNVNVSLASQDIVPSPTPTATPSATISPTPTTNTSPTPAASITPLPKQATSSAVTKPYVEILSTPTGWLRVREDASASSTEVARVNPGDKFPYLITQSGWYQIEYQKGKKGWISATYAKLVQ